MRISVALCTYNGARYLLEQLESLAGQTRLPDEMIVSDDCSVDDSLAIIKDFARQAPFPVIYQINGANLGSSKNFEQAIGRCSGDIIALCDQDDVWLPHKLSVCEELFLKDEELGLVFSDAELVDENLQPLRKKLWDYTFPTADRKLFQLGGALQVLSRQNVITGATMAFRSKYWKACFPIPELEELIHDYWIALVIASFGKVSFVPEPLIKYRQHGTQQLGIRLKKGRTYTERISLIRKLLPSIEELKEDVRNKRFGPAGTNISFGPKEGRSLLHHTLEVRENYLRECCTHYEVRRGLPQNRWRRATAVLREFNTGRYTRHSRALLSALKDLIRTNRDESLVWK